jgi:drug/metabolite transporter (DMT)-like permease
MSERSRSRVLLLTIAALTGFAANSLLCRAALRSASIDPSTFTIFRLLSGAATLGILVWARDRRTQSAKPSGGTTSSAFALFAYAAAFSFAYVKLDAGTGALLLFGAVQVTMVGWGLFRGERPRPREWIGFAIAITGLVILTFPSLSAPPLVPAGLMLAAGIAWGAYSLRGRGIEDPLRATASNFERSVLFTVALVALVLVTGSGRTSVKGALLAVASGALASGLGYSLWYAALRGLSATRAGIVQLAVPVVAATGGIVFLGEQPSLRLVAAACAVLGGIALATLRR